MDKSSASVLLPHGGYKKLRSYKVAEVIYDATVVFCDRLVDRRSRTHDQMVQAARSGVRNISEASGAAATSRKTEIKLTNVARASLSDELANDYRSFLIQNGLKVWDKNSPKSLAMRKRLSHDIAPDLPASTDGKIVLTGLLGLPEFVAKADPEIAANAMLCAINQASYLLHRQIQSQDREFMVNGGFTERLYAARVRAREAGNSDRSDASDLSDKSDHSDGILKCPLCGKAMRLRTAKKGANAGKSFWGCIEYPDCKGTREMSDVSDQSDESDKNRNTQGEHAELSR